MIMAGIQKGSWEGPINMGDVTGIEPREDPIFNMFEVMELSDRIKMPEKSVFVISVRPWTGEPERACIPLYIGCDDKPTIWSYRNIWSFAYIIIEELWNYCVKNRTNFFSFYIGWYTPTECPVCSRNAIYDHLAGMPPEPKTLQNRGRPRKCKQHPVNPEHPFKGAGNENHST